MTTARQIQNEIFGLGRRMKGVNNDIKHRHKSRALTKLDFICDELYRIMGEADNLYVEMEGDVSGN